MPLRSLRSLIAALALAPAAAMAGVDLVHGGTLVDLDISRSFGLPAGWRFTAVQAPAVANWDDEAPGRISLCLHRGGGACAGAVDSGPPSDPEPATHGFHSLDDVRIVHPRGATSPPLLLIAASSLPGFNGDAAVVAQLIAYDRARQGFRRVYRRQTGRNNNQEVRYIARGPLRGDVISAEPTQGAPFGYWITVSTPTPSYDYTPLLRYRSATLYGDGNRLAVIDSEMPAIQRRLGLWHPGMPLPRPSRCAKPRLIKQELWCV